jgi:colanic acid biosynthesis glycosyl transferase WcaI
MRVVVHDYAGHPFPAQLARALAGRGHDVLHLQCASFVTGKGRVERDDGDPPNLAFDSVILDGEFAKYDLRKRIAHELKLGRDLAARIEPFRPGVVLSNAPLLVQAGLQRTCRRGGAGFVFWQQDVMSSAAGRVVGDRSRLAGAAAEKTVAVLERRVARRSDAVVPISEDFVPLLRRWGVEDGRIEVIENWAPLAELPVLPRDNAWAREHDLAGTPVFLYSGTLGFKHDPSLLLELARWAGGRGAVVVVVSEGPGADWLAEHGRDEPALRLLPYQPYERLPEVLATADVLVAILEPEAGAFSVPSKVLTYLCAGRPLLVSVPAKNLAARIVERSEGGVVVKPRDPGALVAAAAALLDDEGSRRELGLRARAYAERSFDLDAVADRFERVLEKAALAVAPTADAVVPGEEDSRSEEHAEEEDRAEPDIEGGA